MSKEDEILRFLLPDLLGKPKAMTDKDGNLIALVDFEFPPDSYIFFISTREWEELNKKGQ